MKKIFFFMAAASMMLVSCQKSLNDVESGREIRMDATTMKFDTKAFAEAKNTTLQTGGFKAAAVIDADNSVMFNKAMAYNSTAGCYGISGEHYYFPNEGTMSFYGIYPADEVIAIANDGKATLAYVHNSDDDLIGAVKKNVVSQSDAVVMDFKHLLSQLSISAKTDDANVVCRLYSITINDVNGGTYSFASDAWTLSEEDSAYVFFNSTAGQAVTTTAAAVGSAMSFMPGEVTLNAKWKCYNKIGEQLVRDNDETIPVTLTKGKHTAITLLLPASSNELKLATDVTAWVDDPQELKAETPYVPELLSGVFTVKAATESTPAKKVKFTKGNLYWNGSAFRCEANQYDYPTTWSTSHIGHFFWSKDARVAIAEDYANANTTYGITPAEDDKFFAADGGVIEGYTALDKDEWQYLFDNALAKNSQSKNTITIDGKACIVLKPDGFKGTVADSYTADEWASAEASGLVAIPLACCRPNTVFGNTGFGSFWTATPNGNDKAYCAYFKDSIAGTYEYYYSSATFKLTGRTGCSCVRLVQVQ